MLHAKPYKGLTVIDASQGFAAPYCAGLLALYGANVIKIEPPEGDWARNIGKNIAGQTALHIVGNRGKRSISLSTLNSQPPDKSFTLLPRIVTSF